MITNIINLKANEREREKHHSQRLTIILLFFFFVYYDKLINLYLVFKPKCLFSTY